MTIILPPRYINSPASALYDPDQALPDPIYKTFVTLLGLAWRTKYESTPPLTIAHLCKIRQPNISERQMRDHLHQLRDAHRIETIPASYNQFIVRFPDLSRVLIPNQPAQPSQPASQPAQPEENFHPAQPATASRPAQPEENFRPPEENFHPLNITDPVVVDQSDLSPEIDHHQQQLSLLLIAYGTFSHTARDIATTCNHDHVLSWLAYAIDPNTNICKDPGPGGFLVSKLLQAKEPPPSLTTTQDVLREMLEEELLEERPDKIDTTPGFGLDYKVQTRLLKKQAELYGNVHC